VQQFQVLLPELFCLRRLGDGFGGLINSVYVALSNKAGMPLEAGQIRVVAKALRRLRQEPFMPFESAVDVVMGLEDSGLEPDPPALAYLAELSDDEGVS
jgi:hypothetical protein